MSLVLAAFVLSLGGIVLLFALKQWESSRVPLIPGVRLKADEKALELKARMLQLRTEADKLGPLAVHVAHVVVREAALGLAAFARYSERQLHRLADFVSHKRGFQRRESHNEFLKRITDHPMRDARQRTEEDGDEEVLEEKGNL